jgi:hypothetical protein
MHTIKNVQQRNQVGLFCFMIIAGLSLMPLSALATISHTKIPEKIRVGITGVLTVEEWNINGKTVEYTLERNFKEYIKDVLPHEWYPDDNPNAHIEILKVGAMTNKTFAWWRTNGDERSSLTGSPDIVDNTADQVYIPLSCTGQETALCKGQTSKRTQNGTGDQAVDDTWTSILKRKDCFKDLEACPDVFEVHYNTTKSGCDTSSFSSFCIPQDDAKDLPNQGKTWKEILTTYYAPLVIYDQQELAVDGTVELLSTCIEIRRDTGNRIYKCRQDYDDPAMTVKKYFCDESNSCKVCQEEIACPEDGEYVALGAQGSILDYAQTLNGAPGESWWKIQWSNDVVGWSTDVHLRPIDGFVVDVQVNTSE